MADVKASGADEHVARPESKHLRNPARSRLAGRCVGTYNSEMHLARCGSVQPDVWNCRGIGDYERVSTYRDRGGVLTRPDARSAASPCDDEEWHAVCHPPRRAARAVWL